MEPPELDRQGVMARNIGVGCVTTVGGFFGGDFVHGAPLSINYFSDEGKEIEDGPEGVSFASLRRGRRIRF